MQGAAMEEVSPLYVTWSFATLGVSNNRPTIDFALEGEEVWMMDPSRKIHQSSVEVHVFQELFWCQLRTLLLSAALQIDCRSESVRYFHHPDCMLYGITLKLHTRKVGGFPRTQPHDTVLEVWFNNQRKSMSRGVQFDFVLLGNDQKLNDRFADRPHRRLLRLQSLRFVVQRGQKRLERDFPYVESELGRALSEPDQFSHLQMPDGHYFYLAFFHGSRAPAGLPWLPFADFAEPDTSDEPDPESSSLVESHEPDQESSSLVESAEE